MFKKTISRYCPFKSPRPNYLAFISYMPVEKVNLQFIFFNFISKDVHTEHPAYVDKPIRR